MRRPFVAFSAYCIAFALAFPGRGFAQAYVSLGGGVQFPTGEYAVHLAPGWIVSGRIGFPVGSKGLSLGVEGFFGRNTYDRNSNNGEGLGGALLFASPQGRELAVGLPGATLLAQVAFHLAVFLWAFESWEDRARRRAALAADPAWPAYRAKNQPRIVHQETRIMQPPPFFEPILRKMLAAGTP